MENEKSIYAEFIDYENMDRHHSYADELRLCEAIQTANPSALELAASLFNAEHAGILSEHSLTNLKYLFVASVTLITRFCIEGGLSSQLAYMISDVHIRALDNCKTEADILALHSRMVSEFFERMAFLRGTKGTSRHIEAAVEYILKNLGTNLTLSVVSREIRISPSHLSHLFIKELGVSFNRYVRLQRTEAAKDLLRYTDHSASAIASLVGFSSQSHMISVFRSVVGKTPANYRKELPKIYGSIWAAKTVPPP